MLHVDIETHREMYDNYKLGIEYLKTVDDKDFEYPDEVTNFHIYSEIKNVKELECVRSFFATQNLEKTKLILWSQYSIEDHPELKPFKDHIDFRVWDALEEAKGTPLEGETGKLLAKDAEHYADSDLLRLLALHKYGGVWVDMDIVILRDFKPILDQEYMYQWGTETDYGKEGACATVISLKKGSEFSVKLLEELKLSKNAHGTWWGKELFASLWSKWPHYKIFPGSFFNTEWMMDKYAELYNEDFGLYNKVTSSWFSNPLESHEHLFLDAFTWHWHNTSHKKDPIVSGSKFDILRDMNTDSLIDRGFSV